ncbi:MAG: hypothetical protein IKD08_04415 [Alphaproteobacteria bacterium]|nr:hypothetical protein [Alphaproteobacteria bacterium]
MLIWFFHIKTASVLSESDQKFVTIEVMVQHIRHRLILSPSGLTAQKDFTAKRYASQVQL